MARVEPAVQSGSLLKLYQALWAPYYQAVLSILGSTGVILPIGDPHHGQPNATSFTTKGGEQLTCTWSEPPSAFDAPLDLTDPDSFQGIVPVLRFNGTDEEADTPDTSYLSRGDGANDFAFSITAWVHVTDTAGVRTILAKYANTATRREWRLSIDGADKLKLQCTDHSVNVVVSRLTDAAIPMGEWVHVAMAYDGAGGASAMDTVTFYANGASVASTPTNDGSYVAMENGPAVGMLGHQQDGALSPSGLFGGRMAGGPLGPVFTQTELTADQVRALYDLGRAALAL